MFVVHGRFDAYLLLVLKNRVPWHRWRTVKEEIYLKIDFPVSSNNK